MIRVAGKEALELGLLFGTEDLTSQEEETDVLCFLHLLLQEFAAAIFLTEHPIVSFSDFFTINFSEIKTVIITRQFEIISHAEEQILDF